MLHPLPEKIIQLRHDFILNEGYEPTKLVLSAEDFLEFQTFVRSQALKWGWQERALGHFLGMEIIAVKRRKILELGVNLETINKRSLERW